MTLSELKTVIAATGVPVAYMAFRTAQTLPFCVFLETREHTTHADGVNYYAGKAVNIELYAAQMQTQAETDLDTALKNAGISYAKSYEYIDDENCYEIFYETEI